MMFSTDDGRLGVIIIPAGTPHMYQFQLVVDGFVLGDCEPCIIGSAMKRLSSLKKLSDARLSPGALSTDALISLLSTDSELHDAATLSLAESMDNWLLRAYKYEDLVVFVGREYRPVEGLPRTIFSVLDETSYDTIIEAAGSYMRENDE